MQQFITIQHVPKNTLYQPTDNDYKCTTITKSQANLDSQCVNTYVDVHICYIKLPIYNNITDDKYIFEGTLIQILLNNFRIRLIITIMS